MPTFQTPSNSVLSNRFTIWRGFHRHFNVNDIVKLLRFRFDKLIKKKQG
jgi:hypothetical protein